MIYVDRTAVEPPSTLFNALAEARKSAVRAFFGLPKSRRSQQRFDFKLQFAQPVLRDTLTTLFHGKCAYCEQRIDFDSGTAYLDRFRPTHGSIGSDGKVATDHYWWLAFEWTNMLGVCAACNRAKGGLFPLSGRRAAVNTIGERLKLERPTLLDPCTDRPELHIAFMEDGLAAGLTERGKTTIGICALNRPDLVTARRTEAKLFLQRLANLSSSTAIDAVPDSEPFAGMKRALFNQHHDGSHASHSARAMKEQKRFDKGHQLTSSDVKHSTEFERSRTRYIEMVSLRNIGVHSKLDIAISRATSSNAPWYVLLGENGVGKSTLLKSMGFVLAGKTQWANLFPLAGSILPTEGIGTIHITFSDGSSLKASIDVDKKEVTSTIYEPRYRVMGFGATRLLPTARHRAPQEPELARLTNLFDPYCPLPDATAWLGSLHLHQFDRACIALRELFDLPKESFFEQLKSKVFLCHGKHKQDIRKLSDGYQTIIGVACGIMSVLLEKDMPIDRAEGIVLIDELGNHLHPRWRMSIVQSLKRAFPRVQFVATTHEPLCLRGLENGEVGVLRRLGPHRVVLMEDMPPVKGLLVDQILASSYFGLQSTVDPTESDELDEYFGLIAKSRRSPKDDARRAELEQRVKAYRRVGTTPSEQILMKVIDEHVAKADRELKPIDAYKLPAALQQSLQELVGTLGFSGEPQDQEQRP